MPVATAVLHGEIDASVSSAPGNVAYLARRDDSRAVIGPRHASRDRGEVALGACSFPHDSRGLGDVFDQQLRSVLGTADHLAIMARYGFDESTMAIVTLPPRSRTMPADRDDTGREAIAIAHPDALDPPSAMFCFTCNMNPIGLSAVADVEAALLDGRLVPPGPPPNLDDGATLELRRSMARFSSPETHASRRASVVGALAALDAFAFAGEARRRTTAILRADADAADHDDRGAFDGYAGLGITVPVETVAVALGVPQPDLADVGGDVRTIVEVIGRRHPSTAASDRAASRLLRRFGGSSPEGVAAVSLLYQTHDATAALFASHLLARDRNDSRRPALAATTRVATASTAIGSTSIPQGATVTIDLDVSGLEFGAGPHACPGRSVAERIVAGMLEAIDAADLELCVDEIEWQPDGRPATLPMRR